MGKELANAFSKTFLLFFADLYFRPSGMLSDLFVHQKLFLSAFMQVLLLLITRVVNQVAHVGCLRYPALAQVMPSETILLNKAG